MFVYVAGRRQGKTSTSIRWLMEDPERRAILCANVQCREDIIRQIGHYVRAAGFSGELASQRYWAAKVRIPYQDSYTFRGLTVYACVDDLGEVLQTMFRVPVDLVTVNGTPIYAEGKQPQWNYDIDGEAWEDERPSIADHPSPRPRRNDGVLPLAAEPGQGSAGPASAA